MNLLFVLPLFKGASAGGSGNGSGGRLMHAAIILAAIRPCRQEGLTKSILMNVTMGTVERKGAVNFSQSFFFFLCTSAPCICSDVDGGGITYTACLVQYPRGLRVATDLAVAPAANSPTRRHLAIGSRYGRLVFYPRRNWESLKSSSEPRPALAMPQPPTRSEERFHISWMPSSVVVDRLHLFGSLDLETASHRDRFDE